MAAAGVIIGFIGNELVALYRIRVGRRTGSAALVADGLHARTDGFTSLAVVLGAFGVWLGFPLADPIAGLLITVAILMVLRTAARDVFARLLDGVDPHLVETAEAALAAEPGVIAAADALDRPPPARRRRTRHRPGHQPERGPPLAHDAEHTLTHAVPLRPRHSSTPIRPAIRHNGQRDRTPDGLVAALLLLGGLAGLGALPSRADVPGVLNFGGIDRTYLVHVPPGPPAGLVINLHGAGQNGAGRDHRLQRRRRRLRVRGGLSGRYRRQLGRRPRRPRCPTGRGSTTSVSCRL